MERTSVIETNLEGLPAGHARVFVRGQFVWPNIRNLRIEINRLINIGFRTFEVDLIDLNYIDSRGLAEFLCVNDLITSFGGTLKLTNPRKLIRHIFVSAHMNEVLDIGPAQLSTSSETS